MRHTLTKGSEEMDASSINLDILKVEGINCKGFGIIPKFILFDTDISIDAKALYSYLCSLAGNGTTAYPCRDTIIYQLHISKTRYYKHFRELIENGYLAIKRNKVSFPFKNVYILISNPKKFQESPLLKRKGASESQIRFSGMKSFGYGIVPYAVMIDDRLNIKAKGIYSYFCGYASSGEAAFPKRELILFHLQISQSTYYKFYNQLVTCNYITVNQRIVAGRYSVNDYYINDTPDITIGMQVQAKKMEKRKKGKTPCTKFEDNRNSDNINRDTVNRYNINEDSNSTICTIPNHNISVKSFKPSIKRIQNANLRSTTFGDARFAIYDEAVLLGLTGNGIPWTAIVSVLTILKTIPQKSHIQLIMAPKIRLCSRKDKLSNQLFLIIPVTNRFAKMSLQTVKLSP